MMTDLLTNTFGIAHITEKLFAQDGVVGLLFIFTISATRGVTTIKGRYKPTGNSQKALLNIYSLALYNISPIMFLILPSGSLA